MQNSFGPATSLPPSVLQYSQPTTGSTVVVNAATDVLIADPSGALLALTVTLPSGAVNGKQVTIACSQAITTLTVNGGTILGNLTAFVAGGFAKFTYNLANTTWYRSG